jgi:uncharacterized protein DUF4301
MNQFSFSKKDINLIENMGLTEAQVYSQISIFQKGTPYVTLNRPCTVGDGIKRFSPDLIKQALASYSQKAVKKQLLKFIPASGAASRMFKILIQAHTDYALSRGLKQARPPNKSKKDKDLLDVMKNCHRFAFFKDLKTSLSKNGLNADSLIKTLDFYPILNHMLTDQGLNLPALPKGLIKFHFYGDHARTAFEEHLVEAAGYVKTQKNDCCLHFTVSPEHYNRFKAFYHKIKNNYAHQFNANFHVSFSTQKNDTNTIAVDLDNRPYRLADGSLFFRPGGHGALIENLNHVDADIVFIKNIDNVAHDRFKPEMSQWKKILCGHLIYLQERIFNFLSQLQNDPITPELVQKTSEWIEKELCIHLPKNDGADSLEKNRATLIHLLNRPLRVCGMVPNVKEPGGGPFWVEDEKGNLSIQIIETSQIDPADHQQQVILNNLTHFNPVDIVCGLKDVQGKSFDLSKHIDHQAVFIAHKTQNGKNLKALEYPGLWNGSMAYWNTVFVEVPLITFNPVKQITDLLRETHQPG